MISVLFNVVRWLGLNIAGFGVGWVSKDIIEGKGVPKEKSNFFLIVLGIILLVVVYIIAKHKRIKL